MTTRIDPSANVFAHDGLLIEGPAPPAGSAIKFYAWPNSPPRPGPSLIVLRVTTDNNGRSVLHFSHDGFASVAALCPTVCAGDLIRVSLQDTAMEAINQEQLTKARAIGETLRARFAALGLEFAE